MNYHVRILRGLMHPNIQFYQLTKADSISGFWLKGFILLLASALIYGISAYFGIGTEYISKQIGELARDEFEMHKALYLIGQILWGIFYAVMIILLPALFFWTMTDSNLKQLATAQFFVLVVLLLEDAILIPLGILFGISEISSPFALGVITQYLTSNEFAIYFLSSISLFKLWVMYLQYKFLRMLTDKSPKLILAMVVGFNLVLWLLSSLFSLIEFEKLI